MAHKPLQSCAALFADAGDPWVTREDWLREEKTAQNRRASTREMESARAFTAPARKRDRRRAQPKPEFWEISQKSGPNPVREQCDRERENLKLMLAGLNACERTIKPIPPETPPPAPAMQVVTDRQAMILRGPVIKPEPTVLPTRERMAKEHAEFLKSRQKHDRWMAEQLGLPYEVYLAGLEAKRAAKR